MTTSNSIHQDFINAQKEFEPARKTSENGFRNCKYADLSVCIDAVKEALNNNNFYLKQVNHDCETGIAIETVFVHVSGDVISSGVLRVPASKNDPQGYGSAMTYARRYSLMSVCGIAPEDDDANSAKPYVKPVNKSNLQQKIDDMKDAQAKLKSKEELVLEGEKSCSKGKDSFLAWYKTVKEPERQLIADKMENFKRKCEEADHLNQDIGQ